MRRKSPTWALAAQTGWPFLQVVRLRSINLPRAASNSLMNSGLDTIAWRSGVDGVNGCGAAKRDLRPAGRCATQYFLATGLGAPQVMHTKSARGWYLCRNEALKEAWVDLAGLAFEKLLRPHRTFSVLCLFAEAANDYKGAMEWCRYALQADGSSADMEQFIFKTLLPQVRKQVVEQWSEIAAVGALLAECGELSQEEVEAVLAPKQKAAKAGR